jgi:hypothetical protein
MEMKSQFNPVPEANMELELIQVDSYGVFDLFDHFYSSTGLIEKISDFIELGKIKKV